MEHVILSSHQSPLWRKSYTYSLTESIVQSVEGNEADLFGTPLPDILYKGVKFKTVQLRYTKKCKRITLQRFLVGKLVHQTNKVERIDILFMYDNLVHLQELAERDEGFRRKFGSALEALTKILKSFTLSPQTNQLNLKKLAVKINQDIPDFPYPLRNLSSVEVHVKKMIYISRYTEQGVENKLLPPKQYIGKGYTDKGTARNPAIDGSPSWQEIAAQPTYIEGEEDDEEENRPTEKDN